MRIAYLITNSYLDPYKNTGYGRHIRHTWEGLLKKGHEVQFLATSLLHGNHNNNASLNEKANVGEAVPTSSLKRLIPSLVWESMRDLLIIYKDARLALSAGKLLRSRKPDVVYERASYLTLSGLYLSRKFGIPLVYEVNAPSVEERITLSGRTVFVQVANWLERYKYRKADRIITVSTALKDYLIDRYNLDDKRIWVNPNGVDVPESNNATPEEQHAENGIQIGFIGSILPYHGVDILIDAFSEIVSQFPDTTLKIVGDGASLGELKSKCSKMQLSRKVIFTGSVHHSKIMGEIAGMDICVMPRSNWYGSPVKIFEYGIMGKAIIAPDVGPVRDVMENAIDGVLVGNTKEELVKALARLISAGELRDRLGCNFQEKIKRQYTWSHNVDRIIEVLNTLPR